MVNVTSENIRIVLQSYERSAERTVLKRDDLIHAAVLVPIVYGGDEPALLLTQRTERVETHKGHIAFPGGMVDPDDRDRTHTALREAEEELGIPASAVEICGVLDDLATPTGFVITPVVGLLRERPQIQRNEEEVADAFYVPLSFFADPSHAEHEFRQVGGTQREIWTYRYNGRVIWGATAAVIRRMMAVLTKPAPNPPEQNAHPPDIPSRGHIP